MYNVSDKYNLCHTASGSRLFGSVVRALDFIPRGSLVRIPSDTWDFFQTYASPRIYEFSYHLNFLIEDVVSMHWGHTIYDMK